MRPMGSSLGSGRTAPGVDHDLERAQAEEELRRRSAILETVGFASSHFLRSAKWEQGLRDVLEHLGRATNVVRVDLCDRVLNSEGRPVLRLREEWSHPAVAARWSFTAHREVPLDEPVFRRWGEALSAGEPVFIRTYELPEPERVAFSTAGIGSLLLLPIILGKQWSSLLGFGDVGERRWSAGELEALRTVTDLFAAALDRVRIEAALRESEAQLQHSQKMEAVGRLAGGVAHDFNNLLLAIQGRTELLLAEPDLPAQVMSDLAEIRAAASRAATLTRQLLAFSRRPLMEPQVLDLNQVVRQMESMVRRLLGEDIILVTRLAPDLWPVQADPGHLEQVLMNLLVNARDAMPEGGAITIETANLELDRAAARRQGVGEAGSYILLQVTDTGCGIPASLHERIFEPFFTTKEQGKGTGLGLSMVWGIVKQSGGHVSVSSTVGMGATFRILLPRSAAPLPTSPAVAVKPEPLGGTETIMLVEDDAAVRSLVRKVLERRGYTVLEATNGAEAIQLVESYPVRIDLILTDVVMPDLNGPTLVERLTQRLPHARVLFMSGYTDQDLNGRGVEPFRAGFISKPFSPDLLAAKVRSILDSPWSENENGISS